LNNDTSKTVKISASIPVVLLTHMKNAMKELGLTSRSRFMANAVASYLGRVRWRLGRGRVAGAILLIYDHERGDLTKKLTHIQHHYLDIIRSTLHLHLDERNCLEIVSIVGDVGKVKNFTMEMEGLRGLKFIDYSFFPLEEEAHGQFGGL